MATPKILVVDDDCTMRAVLRRRLAALGYEVEEASDGLQVLSRCHAGWEGIIILDEGLPSANGRSVARVIRKRCAAPIVFLSGHRREDFRSITMELPDVYYLSKPLDDERLAALLASLTDRSDPRSPSPIEPTHLTATTAQYREAPLEHSRIGSLIPPSRAARPLNSSLEW